MFRKYPGLLSKVLALAGPLAQLTGGIWVVLQIRVPFGVRLIRLPYYILGT